MTNLQSITGSLIWAAIAGTLLLVALEPVSTGKGPAPLAFSAKASATSHEAAL